MTTAAALPPKPPTPEQMIAAASHAMATGTVPPAYSAMTPVQFAVLMMAHANLHGLKVAGAGPWLLEAQHRHIEAMEEVRNGNRHWLHDPRPRAPGDRKPQQAIVRKQAFCVVAIELINTTGKSYEDAGKEVADALASWMGAMAPKPDTVIDWRRWILEEPEKHPELVELYRRARGAFAGEPLPERIAKFLTLISSADVF
jgi:hypothetical protein